MRSPWAAWRPGWPAAVRRDAAGGLSPAPARLLGARGPGHRHLPGGRGRARRRRHRARPHRGGPFRRRYRRAARLRPARRARSAGPAVRCDASPPTSPRWSPHKDQATLRARRGAARDPLPGAPLGPGGRGPGPRARSSGFGASSGSSGRVHLLGHIAEPARLVADADLFVMSSRDEGLGTSVLDAMALGIPVASTTAGGLPEMLQDGAGSWFRRADPTSSPRPWRGFSLTRASRGATAERASVAVSASPRGAWQRRFDGVSFLRPISLTDHDLRLHSELQRGPDGGAAAVEDSPGIRRLSRASTSCWSWTTARPTPPRRCWSRTPGSCRSPSFATPSGRGYAAAWRRCFAKAVELTDRPKRDTAILMHADFAHNPQTHPRSGAPHRERRRHGRGRGAGSRASRPALARLVRRCAPLLLRGMVTVPGVRDMVSGFAAFRLVALRNAIRSQPRPAAAHRRLGRQRRAVLARAAATPGGSRR